VLRKIIDGWHNVYNSLVVLCSLFVLLWSGKFGFIYSFVIHIGINILAAWILNNDDDVRSYNIRISGIVVNNNINSTIIIIIDVVTVTEDEIETTVNNGSFSWYYRCQACLALPTPSFSPNPVSSY